VVEDSMTEARLLVVMTAIDTDAMTAMAEEDSVVEAVDTEEEETETTTEMTEITEEETTTTTEDAETILLPEEETTGMIGTAVTTDIEKPKLQIPCKLTESQQGLKNV